MSLLCKKIKYYAPCFGRADDDALVKADERRKLLEENGFDVRLLYGIIGGIPHAECVIPIDDINNTEKYIKLLELDQ